MPRLIGLLVSLGIAAVAWGDEPADPAAHLGYQPGADNHLADWDQVVSYYKKLDASSPRVAVDVLGLSTEQRPYLAVTISDAATIADLAPHQQAQRRLADPRLLADPAEAKQIVEQSKPVVLITCTIHSNETASTFMAMELAHWLARGDDPRAAEILKEVILVLIPSANPDGVDKVARWYERTIGKPWEGQGMPELYHVHAGHDTNRDWFMLNLPETRLLTQLLYTKWFPTITYDVHQMGDSGARLFVPPFFDPVNPNLNPRVSQGIALIGAHMAAELANDGRRGVLTNAMYDNWWNGGCRTVPQRHNMVGVLTEAASVRLATPIFLDKDQLRGATRGFANHERAVNFVDPWPGGWWRLRDIVEYELICARSVLTLAARYAPMFQGNYRIMAEEAIARGQSEPPYAWIIPPDQADPGRASDLASRLHQSGIEIHRVAGTFRADGIDYPAGSLLLPAAQPYRPHLKDLMERQRYPDRRGPGGAAEPPYDVAGWTLPLLMGVDVAEVRQGLTEGGPPLETRRLAEIKRPAGTFETSDAPFSAIPDRSNDTFRLVNALGRAKVELRRLRDDTLVAGKTWPRGTWLVRGAPETVRTIEAELPNVAVGVVGLPELTAAQWDGAEPAPPRRIGLYQPWRPSMDEGWTRWVLEQSDFQYKTLHDADVRAGHLNQRLDVIILPSAPSGALRDGWGENETDPMFVGGLGDVGADSLREFVQAGGSLIALDESCAYVIETFALPIKDSLAGLPTSTFYGPGSLLAADFDAASPLTRGMPPRGAVYFSRSAAFDVSGAAQARVPVRYAAARPLLSGWLLGADKIEGRPAAVDLDQGKGQIVLFGFPPQFRGQSMGTFRLLFNALWR